MRFRIKGYHLRAGGKLCPPGSVVELDERSARRLGPGRVEPAEEAATGAPQSPGSGEGASLEPTVYGADAAARASATASAPTLQSAAKPPRKTGK